MTAPLELPRRALPMMAPVCQKLAHDEVDDPRREVRERLSAFRLGDRIRPGARVAITVGSRGFGGVVEIVAAIVDAVRGISCSPFVIPAMGSHGGATADGQIEVLSRLGVNEASINAPIQATMAVRPLGVSETGATAYIDAVAAGADAVIVLGRTQAHPENSAGIASGLLKMVTVGLGKQLGAQEAHSHGLWRSIEAVPRLTMASAKIVCGVSVVENAFRRPALIEIVDPAFGAFRDADRRLLEASRRYAATIPFRELDLLIVDELGKNISGTGMDLNVIGRWRLTEGPHNPDYKRIVALSLTRESLGNGLGVGLADFTTERLAREYDAAATSVNVLTASEPGVRNSVEGSLPLVLSSDREAAEVALFSALPEREPRVCRIQSTATLDQLWISESLLEAASRNPDLDVLGSPAELPFDAAGNLF